MAEDLKEPSSYLKNFYPQEMFMVRDSIKAFESLTEK